MTQADQSETLEGRQRRRPWMVALPLVVLLVLAAGWSVFWFFAASATETALTKWQDREAALGRTYRCSEQRVGGFPFRFELRCIDPRAAFSGGERPAALAAEDFIIVAQVWQPNLLIAELKGPLTVGEPDKPPVLSLDWSLAQASLRGLPIEPERVSIVIDALTAASIESGVQKMLANATRLEAHGRIASGSARENPVLDLAVRLDQASSARLGELGAVPFDADIAGTLHGLTDLSVRSVRTTLRALQAADGRLDITRARVQQGDMIATGSGTLRLTPRGTLDGELEVAVTNLEKLLQALGIDRLVAQWVPQGTLERLAPGLNLLLPGLGDAVRRAGAPDSGAKAAAGAAGPRTELNGKQAVTLPLRFVDGVVSLGPFQLAKIPPLY